jgi:hypothetical protein
MDKILLLGDGSLIKGILIIPFAVNGLILVIKGAFAYLENIDKKYTFTKNWQVGAFGVITLLSYLGLFYAVAKIL